MRAGLGAGLGGDTAVSGAGMAEQTLSGDGPGAPLTSARTAH